MKKKLSVSIEEATISKLDSYVESGLFRNKSHVIEFALQTLMGRQENE